MSSSACAGKAKDAASAVTLPFEATLGKGWCSWSNWPVTDGEREEMNPHPSMIVHDFIVLDLVQHSELCCICATHVVWEFGSPVPTLYNSLCLRNETRT